MIKHELNGKFTVKLSEKATSSLNNYKPKGCPFICIVGKFAEDKQ